MQIMSTSFGHGQRIPDEYTFCAPDPAAHVRMSANRNPHLRWSGVPSAAKSLVLLCVDPDVPTRPDDVNQEGRSVPASLPRADFHHWAMVDIPPTVVEIAAGACSNGITARGKQSPAGPAGSRQGINDYTSWFAGDSEMGGQYFGYDGPCPPWNDELLHHYHFVLYATDLARCPVDGAFTGPQVAKAIAGHVLAEARLTGTYSLNPAVR
ncbi:MAG TPA: YbhB/YbcL family Raf kinase inhibitor-like protein [Steroidobacteraceae bacterium]|nr:YbhB/YbcL family Raf kinase inhibitor-like protein [Steroidobacteraceae bacterium]